jgi:hypothetical protein
MLGAVRASASGGTALPTVNSAQVLTAASSIAITSSIAFQVCPVSAASNITLSSNPQIATGSNGQEVTVINTGTFTITFIDSNGLGLNGTLVLGQNQFATFKNLGGFWQLGDTDGSAVWTALTYSNSFADVGGNIAGSYTKFLGVVEVRGAATKSGAYSTAVVIATLPTGFRPIGGALGFPSITSTLTVNLAVDTSGGITYTQAAGSSTSQTAHLNAIRFRV